ncbi:YceI family protein [uncultured Mucilaginibacter sp.]|uniref:YceI family protein n=1 Tax=uncultured Mucilaginibacter sp. TaxID=797541 RepID=UPI0025EA6ACD|nr:YceI family protein [uncultured Mucilaginibacter sp.]
MKKAIILFMAVMLGTAAFAQTTWTNDKMHSKVGFTVTHLMVSDVDGIFTDFTCTIVAAKPDFSDAKFQLTVNTSSVNTDIDYRDKDLRSDKYFDVAKFPTMTFTSSAIASVSPNHYKLTGNLTLHGVTKPVSMDLWFRGLITNPMTKKDDAGFKLTGVIKRSDFGFGSGTPSGIVSDEVIINTNGEFGKQ